MKKMKLFAGILVFGSLWGFSECVIGSMLRSAGLPAGAIMTGAIAFSLMMISRMFYKTRGMQLGMGIVAGALRLFNPFGGCFICSAIAIMAEGVVFELLWNKISPDFNELDTLAVKSGAGIVTSYSIYVVGYIVTQILTPVISSAGFHIENLIVFIPQILAGGLLAAVIGGIMAPILFLLRKFSNLQVRSKLYYPATIGVSALCWLAVLANI
ncbi:MAG: hypothetical protein J7L66_06360 [Anaerolineaceae bacterium]|nr:hypothetical protein [Anaerolineaceae bacterium]